MDTLPRLFRFIRCPPPLWFKCVLEIASQLDRSRDQAVSCHLSTPEARKGRGSEHGGFYAARSCTSGVDRRSRTEPSVRRETNVEGVDQPKAAPHCFSGSALRAGDRPAWMGSVERQLHRRSQRGKGQSRLPASSCKGKLDMAVVFDEIG